MDREQCLKKVKHHFSPEIKYAAIFIVLLVVVFGAILKIWIPSIMLRPSYEKRAMAMGSQSAEVEMKSKMPEVTMVQFKSSLAINVGNNELKMLPKVSQLKPETIGGSKEGWKFRIFVNLSTGEYVAIRKIGATYEGLVQLNDGVSRGNVNRSTVRQAELPSGFKKDLYTPMKNDFSLLVLQEYFGQINDHFHCFK